MNTSPIIVICIYTTIHLIGIYFDNGELQILLESKEPKGFLGVLRKLF